VADYLAEYEQLTSSRGLTGQVAESLAISVPPPAEYHDRTPLSDEAPPKPPADAMRELFDSPQWQRLRR